MTIKSNKKILCAVFLLAIFAEFCFAVDAELPGIEIKGSRLSRNTANTSCVVRVLTAEEIKNSGAKNAAELFSAAGGDLGSRGVSGATADLSLRGSTYQQVAVLVDGIPVYDPQTAHHNTDIPVNISDIERVEVFQGYGSAEYGSGAIGGVINIVTKKENKSGGQAEFSYSGFNTRELSASYTAVAGALTQRVSLGQKYSDGYAFDMDLNSLILNSNTSLDYTGGKIDFSLGYAGKEFGAYDFYTPYKNYPSREWTSAVLASLGAKQLLGNIEFTPRLYYRKHYDRYVLNQSNPGLYMNIHNAYTYGGEAAARLELPDRQGSITLGFEAAADLIESSQLGNHLNEKYAIFSGFSGKIMQGLNADLALRGDFSGRGPVYSPSAGLSLSLMPEFRTRITVSKAFRAPSFTELYYNSPGNTGTPALAPETAVLYEAGLSYLPAAGPEFTFNLFDRKQTNTIDWVGTSVSGPWVAANVPDLRMHGLEFTVLAELEGFTADIRYSFTGSTISLPYISKYALRYAKNYLSVKLETPAVEGIKGLLTSAWTEREGEAGYVLCGLRLSKNIGTGTEIYFQGNNLFNTQYEAIPGVPGPGASVGLGVRQAY